MVKRSQHLPQRIMRISTTGPVLMMHGSKWRPWHRGKPKRAHDLEYDPYSFIWLICVEENTMQGVPQRHGIFYGWVIVATAGIIVGIGMGLMFSVGVFMEPLETDFGWGRGQIAQGILYSWVMFGVFSLIFGALSDRFSLQ